MTELLLAFPIGVLVGTIGARLQYGHWLWQVRR
jgi:hypothetical protein